MVGTTLQLQWLFSITVLPVHVIRQYIYIISIPMTSSKIPWECLHVHIFACNVSLRVEECYCLYMYVLSL